MPMMVNVDEQALRKGGTEGTSYPGLWGSALGSPKADNVTILIQCL